MKILIVSVDFPPHTDGVSSIAGELAKRLVAFGKEVIVIGPQAQGTREFDAVQRYKVYRTPGYHWGYLRLLPILVTMPYVLWRHRPDCVIPMNIAYGGILSLFLSRLFGFTYIMWAYGYEFWKFREHPFLRKLYLKVYHRACKVIAITRFVQERLMEFGVKEGHIAVVYPGTDPQRYYPFSVNGEFLSRYGLEAKKRMVLSVCRIIERKGIDTVIRALPRVKEVFPDVLYVISGDGDYRPALERLVEEEGLAGSVRFLGRVPDQDLPKLYNACEVFVMVSREIRGKGDIEGFGIVYLEANACAKPVIGSRQGGMKEAIEEGVSGLLVEPDNVDEVVSSLCRLLKDREFSLKLGRAGQQRVLETMNWDRCYKEFLSVLENSAGS